MGTTTDLLPGTLDMLILNHETRDRIVRSNVEAAVLAPAMVPVLRDVEPDIPRAPLQRMDEVIGGALTRPRFYAAAVGGFSLIAVLLAAFGIFGAVTSAVADRRRELGVRLALGASPMDILVRLPTMVRVQPSPASWWVFRCPSLEVGFFVSNSTARIQPTCERCCSSHRLWQW